jgi:hypothetical protein
MGSSGGLGHPPGLQMPKALMNVESRRLFIMFRLTSITGGFPLALTCCPALKETAGATGNPVSADRSIQCSYMRLLTRVRPCVRQNNGGMRKIAGIHRTC